MTTFYPPHIEFSGQPEIGIYAPTGGEPTAVIHWDGGNEHVDGDAQADERISVYLRAKEMLAAHRNAVACHAGIGEYVAEPAHVGEADAANLATAAREDAAECGAIHPAPLGFGCTEPPGHEPFDHIAMGGDTECARWPAAEGLPVDEDDGGDGDDNREPYCTVCLFTLDAKGRHLYPDDVIPDPHDPVMGWREPVGVPSGEDAQSAEVRRIGKLHTDGHITDAECAQMVDKVLGEHA